MRIVMNLFIGAVVGFLASFIFLDNDFVLQFPDVATEMTIIFGVVTLLLIIFSIVGIAKVKKKSKAILSGNEEDERNDWMYKKYSDASLAGNISSILGIMTTCIAVITDQPIWLAISTAVLALLGVYATINITNTMKYVYPERNFPSYNDKNYSKKLLAMSDEGERHIILEGLYSAHNLTNGLLLLGIVLLLFYSEASGQSQLFSIIMIAIILIVSNTRYMLKIRNR